MAHSKECTTTYSSVQHPSLFKRVSFFLSGRDALRKRWTLVISPSEQWWRKRKELEERETKLSEGAPSPFPRPLHYFSDVYQNDQYQGVAMIFFSLISPLCALLHAHFDKAVQTEVPFSASAFSPISLRVLGRQYASETDERPKSGRWKWWRWRGGE